MSNQIAIANANDLVPAALETGRARSIVFLRWRPSVHGTVDFHYELVSGAVEVDDEPTKDVLAAELETEHLPIAQQRPSKSLCARRLSSQGTREGMLLRDREAT